MTTSPTDDMQPCCAALHDRLENAIAAALGVQHVGSPDRDDPERDGESDMGGLLERTRRLAAMVASLQAWASSGEPLPRDAEILRQLLLESRQEPDLRRAYDRLRRRRAADVEAESRAAGSSDPWWAIVDPQRLGRNARTEAEAALGGYLTGPFFSEAEADEAFRIGRSSFSSYAQVVVFSGSKSPSYHAFRVLP